MLGLQNVCEMERRGCHLLFFLLQLPPTTSSIKNLQHDRFQSDFRATAGHDDDYADDDDFRFVLSRSWLLFGVVFAFASARSVPCVGIVASSSSVGDFKRSISPVGNNGEVLQERL